MRRAGIEPFARLPARLLVVAALLLAPFSVQAHETGSVHLHAFGELGGRVLDREPFLVLRPGLVVESESLVLVLAPLIQLGLDEAGRPRLRPEDLDSPSDYGRILYLLDIRDRGGRFRLRAGSLSHERLGNGTVVSDYVASLDPDSWHTGLRFDLSSGSVELEALAGALLSPGLIAARISVAPVSVFGAEGRTAEAFRTGLLLALDPTAPIRLTGELGQGGRPGAQTRPVAFAALDTRLAVYRDHRLLVEPYADGVLTIAGPRLGRGAVHLGVLTAAGYEEGPRISLRAEARRLGSGYLAEHFDAFYSLERWGYPIGGAAAKAMVDALAGGWGGKGELILDRAGTGLFGLSFDGRKGGPFNAGARVALDGWGPVSGAAFVAIRGMAWPEGGGSPTGIGVAELRFGFTGAIYLVARGGRTFRVDRASARHRPIWDAALSIGATL